MSKTSSKSNLGYKEPHRWSSDTKPRPNIYEEDNDGRYEVTDAPEFIYGGPFIRQEKPSPILNTATPINLPLQGTFKKSFAYESLKDRLPVILTQVIDNASKRNLYTKLRELQSKRRNKKHSQKDEEPASLDPRALARIARYADSNPDKMSEYVAMVAKLKSDLVTNKEYTPLQHADTEEAKKWNTWIEAQDNKHYFTNNWLFTECYVYRKLSDGIVPGPDSYDPFQEQKEKSFTVNLEPMCILAEKLKDMLPEADRPKKKADFQTLLKICLWANKCDLSLTMGQDIPLGTRSPDEPLPPTKPAKGRKGKAAKAKAASAAPTPADSKTKLEALEHKEPPEPPVIDPFQMIIDYKAKLILDHTSKATEQVLKKSEKMATTITGEFEVIPAVPLPEGAEPPKIPCPTKMKLPQSVFFDIVCDNSGYELFTDICLAHFIISQGIAQKVRFHVKSFPWFVSDVTPRDFKHMIAACKTATYRREIRPKPAQVPEGQEPPPSEGGRVIDAEHIRALAPQWEDLLNDGTFIICEDSFWTSPFPYRDMKKQAYNLYRKLQYAIALLFKGDLNYRKLVGDRCLNPVSGLALALQGFHPAPIIACRTVKSDLICGLSDGRFEQLNNEDPKWITNGQYGVIQFTEKTDPMLADHPCADYGDL